MKFSLTEHPTTDLHDAHPTVAVCRLPFIDYGGKKRFAGRIRTLVTAEDTGLAREFYGQAGEGAVAVVDGGGSLRSALLGDLNAALLAKGGWAGIIVNGAIRDSEGLATINLGVKALAATPVRSGKTGVGAIDTPVAFGGVLFTPGHCVYCDTDGVLVAAEPLPLKND